MEGSARRRRCGHARTYLGHLERNNFSVGTLSAGGVACVGADNLGPLGVAAIVLDALVAESSLVLGKRDTGDTAAIVLVREGSEGTPAATNVEKVVFGLEIELRHVLVDTGGRWGVTRLLADNGQLVVLELLKRLLPVDITNDTRRVNHARAKEPLVEIVSSCRDA